MSGLFAMRGARGAEKGEIEELRALDYDGQTSNFTVGQVITGGTSGATGILVEQTDAGATGTLILKDVKGDFENNDALTDEGSGDGNATGADYCPLLTPDDEVIVQIDAVDMDKSEAIDVLEKIISRIQRMDWPSAAAP